MKFSGIIENDIVDSIDGLTVSFWTQGCPFKCKNCHNPQTWNKSGGYDLQENYIEIIKELITKNGIFRNLSILGGEPLYDENINIVYDLIVEIRKTFPNINIYLWTGFTLKQLKKMKNDKINVILNNITYLIDGLYDENKKDSNLILRGSSNQIVWKNEKGKFKKFI